MGWAGAGPWAVGRQHRLPVQAAAPLKRAWPPYQEPAAQANPDPDPDPDPNPNQVCEHQKPAVQGADQAAQAACRPGTPGVREGRRRIDRYPTDRQIPKCPTIHLRRWIARAASSAATSDVVTDDQSISRSASDGYALPLYTLTRRSQVCMHRLPQRQDASRLI